MALSELKNRVNNIISKQPGEYAYWIETSEGYIENNGDLSFPAASLIKLPIMIEAFCQAQKHGLDLTAQIHLKEDGKAGGAGVLHLLTEGATLTWMDLVTLMIVVSDNTAANLLIDQTGMANINEKLADLGCSQTVLERKLMDFEAIKRGKNNRTTARDVGMLLKVIDHGSILSEKSRKAALNILQNQQFRYKLPAYMDEEKIVIANKTGELDGIEHDAGIFTFQSEKVMACVLTKNLESEAEGREAIALIGKEIYEHFRSCQKY